VLREEHADQDDREAAEMRENFLRCPESDNDEEHVDEKEKEAIWMIICGDRRH
jgi:hypothetical protein